MTEQLDMGTLIASGVIVAVLVVALISMAISQIALQAGDLPPVIATESIVAPLVSVALGLGLYLESLHESSGGAFVSLLALAAMLAGVALLARREGTRLES